MADKGQEVLEELEALDNNGETKATKEIRDTAAKYCKNEWQYGGAFLVHAALVAVGHITEEEALPDDIVMTSDTSTDSSGGAADCRPSSGSFGAAAP